MNDIVLSEVKQTTGLKDHQIKTVLELLDEGNTIPFIARYRKEATGGLDEEQINEIYKSWSYAQSLKRKEDVIRLIAEKEMLTPELEAQILNATKLVEVEDLYRPFKEKKKTKATEAIAKGLEPLAHWLLTFPSEDVLAKAHEFLSDKVKTENEALEGAGFIISEIISDNAQYRKALRVQMFFHGSLESNLKKNAIDEKKVYENYYAYSEPISKVKPHRVLAINRGEDEKILIVKVNTPRDQMIAYLENKVILKEESTATPYLKLAIDDALKRLIYPSLEREIRSDLTEKAEDQAIEVFASNLQKLLLQPPLKGKVVLGVDPAFRTGCKLSVVSQTGEVLSKSVIYPHEKKSRWDCFR